MVAKKKSKIFTKDQVFSYVRNAPDTSVGLRDKLILLIGFYGALRVDDLVKLTWDKIEFKEGEGFWVKLLSRKTGAVQNGHSFLMPKCHVDPQVCPVEIAKKYQNLLASKGSTGRVFMSFRHGKFTANPLGKNKIREIPKLIAQFLELEDSDSYTGQCFRRSSATSLADSGISRTNLKRHGGWKSDSVAEGYLSNSKKMRKDIANMLSETPTNSLSEGSGSGPVVYNFNFSNCNNVNVNQPPPGSDFTNQFNPLWASELPPLDSIFSDKQSL